jgi:tetrahydromethanopterin S-methyltransferase subunit D
MTQAAVLGANASIMSTPVGTAPGYMARAWVNFNGTGTVAIRASGNVTSITDNGTGDYTVNFTTALPDINFSINGICSSLGGNNCPMVFDNSPVRARTTSSASIRTMDINNFGDPVWANVSVFR